MTQTDPRSSGRDKPRARENQAHTPGPWTHKNGLVFRTREEDLPELFYENDVATTTGPSTDRRKANARRIVAAVNACEGISTEALEDGVVADLLAACKAVLDDWHGKPSNFERKEPPYLQQIRIAIAPSPGPGR